LLVISTEIRARFWRSCDRASWSISYNKTN